MFSWKYLKIPIWKIVNKYILIKYSARHFYKNIEVQDKEQIIHLKQTKSVKILNKT